MYTIFKNVGFVINLSVSSVTTETRHKCTISAHPPNKCILSWSISNKELSTSTPFLKHIQHSIKMVSNFNCLSKANDCNCILQVQPWYYELKWPPRPPKGNHVLAYFLVNSPRDMTLKNKQSSWITYLPIASYCSSWHGQYVCLDPNLVIKTLNDFKACTTSSARVLKSVPLG